MQDNLSTFRAASPLSASEAEALLQIAEGMKSSVPCTACRYCTPSCPRGLDIPLFLEIYNELSFAPVVNTAMRLDHLPSDKQPSACIGCGACARMCPQHIDIPGTIRALCEKLASVPKWADICRQREEAARRLAEESKK